MRKQAVKKSAIKDLIQSIEVGISGSSVPFSFLALKFKRELSPEETAFFHEFQKNYRGGVLPLLPAQIQGCEMHLLPKVAGSPLPNRADGTLTTALRVAQAFQREFGTKRDLSQNYSLQPFGERVSEIP